MKLKIQVRAETKGASCCIETARREGLLKSQPVNAGWERAADAGGLSREAGGGSGA